MNAPTNLGDYAVEFAQMYLDISTDLDLAVVPEFLSGSGWRARDEPAGRHAPTPEGHTKLADNIHRALVSMLGNAPARAADGR